MSLCSNFIRVICVICGWKMSPRLCVESRKRPLCSDSKLQFWFSVAGCRLRVAGCVFRGAVAGGCAFSDGMKTQPQPATRSCVSSGVPACVCVPYIYNLKKIIYNILYRVTPCRGSHNPKKYGKTQPRVAGCKLRFGVESVRSGWQKHEKSV